MGNKPPMPNDRMRNVIKTYSLSKSEQKRLWKLFKTIDRDGSGEIDVNEFMKWLVEPVNSFTKGIFRLIDTDQSNTLDYFEFCDALCSEYALHGLRVHKLAPAYPLRASVLLRSFCHIQ